MVYSLCGGQDSSVVTVLLHEAVGDQLQRAFVDHGLLRKDEGEQVVRLFRDHYNIPLVHADASKRFLDAQFGRVASRIIKEMLGIYRVTYDITSKLPAAIERE